MAATMNADRIDASIESLITFRDAAQNGGDSRPGRDFNAFHQDLAELMIAEVQSRGGEFTAADFDKLERLALGAVVPEMLASHLAIFAARAREQMKTSA